MKWQTIVAMLVAAPVLALFGGAGFLAYQIGENWDARSTDSLIAGLISVCAGGALVIGILLALIVGIPLALRAYERGGSARQAWPDQQYRALPPARPAWAEQPPLIADKSAGTWETLGPGQYDLWDNSAEMDQQAAPREWGEQW